MQGLNEKLDAEAAARVGRVLNEKWTLERLIGVGGMAAVYGGRHRNGARAAVKILHAELGRNPAVRERFLREGYAANRVEHRGAVQVLDDDIVHGGPDDGAAYLVMELLEGESVEARAAHAPPVDEQEYLTIANGVLQVLEAAHEHGVVHRDLKPDNIFLARDPDDGRLRVKVLDFGLARLTESQSTTQLGLALGTPSYMSPEQAAGRAGEIDGRTDLFALGATGFRLLTLRRIHEEENVVRLVSKMANEPAPPIRSVLPSISEPVAAIIDRALAFNREDRYPSAAAMRADVQAARDAIEPESVRMDLPRMSSAQLPPSTLAKVVQAQPALPKEPAQVTIALSEADLETSTAALQSELESELAHAAAPGAPAAQAPDTVIDPPKPVEPAPNLIEPAPEPVDPAAPKPVGSPAGERPTVVERPKRVEAAPPLASPASPVSPASPASPAPVDEPPASRAPRGTAPPEPSTVPILPPQEPSIEQGATEPVPASAREPAPASAALEPGAPKILRARALDAPPPPRRRSMIPVVTLAFYVVLLAAYRLTPQDAGPPFAAAADGAVSSAAGDRARDDAGALASASPSEVASAAPAVLPSAALDGKADAEADAFGPPSSEALTGDVAPTAPGAHDGEEARDGSAAAASASPTAPLATSPPLPASTPAPPAAPLSASTPAAASTPHVAPSPPRPTASAPKRPPPHPPAPPIATAKKPPAAPTHSAPRKPR